MPSIRRKRPTNLSLAPDRLAFAHGYAKAHATSLSELVDTLLGALEVVTQAPEIAPSLDPLDGILLSTPMAVLDKRELRRAHHEGRLDGKTQISVGSERCSGFPAAKGTLVFELPRAFRG